MSVRIIEVKENVTSHNDRIANETRAMLKEKGIFMLNLMSSPGSGKTTTLTKIINALKDEYRIAEMDVDIESSVDAEKVADTTGVRSLQIHNGGLCHIDADMTKRALDEFGTDDTDLIFLENIGNLVCPAEFDTGAVKNAMILSIPEGDDKPLKYPLMFTVCDLVLINKIDALPVFDFNVEKAKERILRLNPKAEFILISAKTGEGIPELAAWLKKNISEWRA